MKMKYIIPFLIFINIAVFPEPELISVPAAGGVTHNSARMRVMVSEDANIRIRLSESDNFSGSFLTEQVRADSLNYHTVIIEIKNLEPQTKYYYSILINGNPADDDKRSFSTFPIPGSITDFLFAFGSCQQSNTSATGEVFKEVVKTHPAFFVQTGDWTYPDTTERLPADLDFFPLDYQRVVDTYRFKFRKDYGMDTLLRSVPVSYVYDDHDYLNNNSSAGTVSYVVSSGSSISLQEISVPPLARQNSIKGFVQNMPDYPVENQSRGIYRKFTYANSEIFMLDLRSQRSPNFNSLRKNAAGKWEFIQPAGHTILGNSESPGTGEDQFTWLKKSLLQSSAVWKFIVSSVPFNRGQLKGMRLGIQYQDSIIQIPNSDISIRGIAFSIELADKWVGFIEELDSLLSFIYRNNISNVFIISGDSHTSAIDDGTNAGLPEIMAANLDIRNSRSAAVFKMLGFNIWNSGGQWINVENTENTFGTAEVFGKDSVKFSIIDETGFLISSMTLYDQAGISSEIKNFRMEKTGQDFLLKWETEETMSIDNFEIQKSSDGILYTSAGSIKASGSRYSYPVVFDHNITHYRLKISGSNKSFRFSEAINVSQPAEFELMQNFPNPFNTSTTIRFNLVADAVVNITIYNLMGEKVIELINEFRQSGEHRLIFNAANLASGVYFYRITADAFTGVKKMILLK